MKDYILLFMLFAHVVDDFYLQGILAKLKQKSWWEQNHPEPLYRYDYIVGLLMHSFSWSFMIILPILILVQPSMYFICLALIANTMGHALIDDLKANKGHINLIADQGCHLLQIIITYFAFLYR